MRRPRATSSPASSTSMVYESIDTGTSTTSCTARTASRILRFSISWCGSPVLTSMTAAPAATCRVASRWTYSQLPSS